MRQPLISLVTALLVGSAACGGGGDGGTTGPSNQNPSTGNPTGTATNGTFTAQINGVTWNATGPVTVSRQTSGNFVGFIGSGLAGSAAYAISLTVGNVTGPGTFSLGAGNTIGSQMIIGSQTGGWGTSFPGGVGTLTITTLTSNRITGTFSGDGRPGTGSATGTLEIRNGRFDLSY